MTKPVPPGRLHEVARSKMAAVLGPKRADELLASLVTSHALSLDNPDDLLLFADKLTKRGGFEGAIGAMLGLQAVMLGSRRLEPPAVDPRGTLTATSAAAILVDADRDLRAAKSVEEGAQTLAALVAGRVRTVPLCRFYMVLPMRQLGGREVAAARRCAAGTPELLRADTPVLVLLGSAGVRPEWCDRRRSRDHLAIPLVSSEFVRSAPMIAAMLAELGVDLAGFDDASAPILPSLGADAMFYVRDAQVDVDAHGRRVIPAVSFVEGNAIRTVFGMGGTYADGTLAVAIAFAQEVVERPTVRTFGRLMELFKAHTAGHLAEGRLFSDLPVATGSAK